MLRGFPGRPAVAGRGCLDEYDSDRAAKHGLGQAENSVVQDAGGGSEDQEGTSPSQSQWRLEEYLEGRAKSLCIAAFGKAAQIDGLHVGGDESA